MLLIFTERLNTFESEKEMETEFSFEHANCPIYLASKWRLNLTSRECGAKTLVIAQNMVVLAWGF